MKASPRPSVAPLSRRRFLGATAATAAATTVSAWRLPSAEGGPGKEGEGYLIGAYTRAWGRRDYRVALDGMAEAGYRYAGISVHDGGRVIDRDSPVEAAEALGTEVGSRGLSIVTLSAGSFEADQPVETGVAQLRHLIDLGVACAAPGIQINEPGIDKPELEETFYRVVAECCDYAEEQGIALNIHPHGAPGAHIRERIDAVGHPALKLMYDPGNVGFYSHGEIDLLEDAASLDGMLYGMSVKDYELPRNVSIDPGSGLVDFPGVLERLHAGGFTSGPLVVECLHPGELEEVTAAARRAREFVEGLVAGIGEP